jgi:hypothetical protein
MEVEQELAWVGRVLALAQSGHVFIFASKWRARIEREECLTLIHLLRDGQEDESDQAGRNADGIFQPANG